jgi:hypothetical protein
VAALRKRRTNPSQHAITRTRAVCRVEFLANIPDIGGEVRLASHPDPGAAPLRELIQRFLNSVSKSTVHCVGFAFTID